MFKRGTSPCAHVATAGQLATGMRLSPVNATRANAKNARPRKIALRQEFLRAIRRLRSQAGPIVWASGCRIAARQLTLPGGAGPDVPIAYRSMRSTSYSVGRDCVVAIMWAAPAGLRPSD
jgi:hypothetical protein